jgi:hypothetical protein
MSQDSPRRTRTQAWAESSDGKSAVAEGEIQPLAVLSLGVCAWLATAGYTWVSLPANEWTIALALAALVLLGTGVGALYVDARNRLSRAARWLLLSAFPFALACTWLPHDARRASAVHGAFTLPLSLGCVLLYEALALAACRYHGESLQVRTRTLEGQAVAGHEPTTNWLRRIVVALMAMGAAAVALIAPLWPSYDTLVGAWGPATADAGAVLTAVVGGAIGTAICGPFLGSLLRRASPPKAVPPHELRTRIATLLFLSLLGGVVYFTITS